MMRGIYLANHFNNYYEAASPEELEHYVEDLSLWGFNLLALGFPHWQYESYDYLAVDKMIDQMQRMMRTAKQVGMRVSVGAALNSGFRSTPQELRCTPVPYLGPTRQLRREPLSQQTRPQGNGSCRTGNGCSTSSPNRAWSSSRTGLMTKVAAAAGHGGHGVRGDISESIACGVGVGAQEISAYQGHRFDVDLRHASLRRMAFFPLSKALRRTRVGWITFKPTHTRTFHVSRLSGACPAICRC